jgi:hypothetical protein
MRLTHDVASPLTAGIYWDVPGPFDIELIHFPDPTSPIFYFFTPAELVATQLLALGGYVQISSESYPTGEIRGVLTPDSCGEGEGEDDEPEGEFVHPACYEDLSPALLTCSSQSPCGCLTRTIAWIDTCATCTPIGEGEGEGEGITVEEGQQEVENPCPEAECTIEPYWKVTVVGHWRPQGDTASALAVTETLSESWHYAGLHPDNVYPPQIQPANNATGTIDFA